jgi:hypothetical protein
VRHVASAINILGFDYQAASLQTQRLHIRHNLFYDVDASRWGGDGRFLLVGDEPSDIIVDHNTVIQSGSILLLYGTRDLRPRSIVGFQLTNNLALHNEFGIFGDAVGIGQTAIAAYLSREDIRRNVLAGADASRYPSDNFFPSVAEFLSMFVNRARHDYRLRPSSQFRAGATDGSMIGADVDAIMRGVPPKASPGRRPRGGITVDMHEASAEEVSKISLWRRCRSTTAASPRPDSSAYSLISSGTETDSLHQAGIVAELRHNPSHLQKAAGGEVRGCDTHAGGSRAKFDDTRCSATVVRVSSPTCT